MRTFDQTSNYPIDNKSWYHAKMVSKTWFLTMTDYKLWNSITTLTLTSIGIVSPGKTNTESPTRMSSVGTSTHIASELSMLSLYESLSEGIITSRDCVDISDCKNTQKTRSNKCWLFHPLRDTKYMVKRIMHISISCWHAKLSAHAININAPMTFSSHQLPPERDLKNKRSVSSEKWWI